MSIDEGATVTGFYAQMELAPGTIVAGRFRIEALLGIGGMGMVYRAFDTRLDVPVAIKLLRPELAAKPEAFERFRQELLLARQVSNPHVVRIHDLASHEGRWLISMDYVDGEPLDKRLDRSGSLSFDEALKITRQLAEGLGAAHARGVIHRDLKPANVLLDAQGNAYISDFGVARSLTTSGLTQSGAIAGTPDYLAPEQARGEPVDARTDLYALGLMLFEMLSGQLPFGGGTLAEVLAQRMVRTPPPVTQFRPDTPPWLARLIDRLLRPQPAHRLQSAGEVIKAIDTREVPRDFRLGRSGWLALAATLAIATGVGGWWLMTRDATPMVAVASKPLNRLLLSPIAHQGGDAALDRQLAALSAQLRDALSARSELVVVDGDRTAQALRQLDPSDSVMPDLGELRRIAASQRVLRPRLEQRSDQRWRIRGEWLHGDGKAQALEGPIADTPVEALQGWLALPGVMQTLGLDASQPLALDAYNPQALDAYGAALLSRARGALPETLAQMRLATAAAPDDAALWLAQAETALAIGDQDTAFDALERGEQSATKAPEGLRRRLKAERALIEGDPPAAAAEWRALLSAKPDDTFAELNLARALGNGGDYNGAIAALKSLSTRDGNDPRVWFELGKFSILQGDARTAVDEYLVRALVLYKRSRNTFGEAETGNALGIGYGRLGQTADAAEQYRKAVELRRQVGNKRGVATSLRNLANVLSMTGKFDEAAQHLEQARALHVELGDRDGLAAVENELGLLAEERGDYRGALEAFRRALSAWQQSGDPHGIAQALNDIGFAHFQLGAYDDAQVYWQQAADAYAKSADRTGEIRTGQNLGLLDVARGRWDAARERLNASLASAGQQQMLEEAAVSRRNLAELELLQGHLGAAIEHAQKAETLFQQREDLRGRGDAGLLRVRALLAARAPQRAQSALDALAPALAESGREQRAIAQVLRAQIATDSGNAAQANSALQQAQQLARASGVRALQVQIALQQARSAQHAPAQLDRDTATLGNAALRLEWLQLAMQQALAGRNPTAALAAYREATSLLRQGDHLHAEALHRLGEIAFSLQGDATAAKTAQTAADQAHQVVRAALTPALRAEFDAASAIATQPGRRK